MERLEQVVIGLFFGGIRGDFGAIFVNGSEAVANAGNGRDRHEGHVEKVHFASGIGKCEFGIGM